MKTAFVNLEIDLSTGRLVAVRPSASTDQEYKSITAILERIIKPTLIDRVRRLIARREQS